MTGGPTRVWRITASRFSRQALSGEGGLQASGRWHRRGVPVVYASQSPELAVLETLVHLAESQVPPALVLLGIDIDPSVRFDEIPVARLPRGWRKIPAPPALADLGMEWLARGRGAALWVPSAVIPLSRNLIINPRHADVSKMTVATRQPFPLDPRLERLPHGTP